MTKFEAMRKDAWKYIDTIQDNGYTVERLQ